MNIIRRGQLDLKLLHRLEEPPELFCPGDLVFWTDPYISDHVLEAHLDPESDDASRREETILSSVEHISRLYPATEYPRLLDLGCGPGLYSRRFCDAGFAVTGIDFSHASICYAREDAAETGREIRYLEMDYRGWLPEEGEYDLVVMIFGDFCVLSPRERDRLLARIRRALKPGGLFLFDVFTELYLPHPDQRAWYTMLTDGFWSPDENLVLELKHRYPDEQVHLNRYLIIGPDGGLTTANLWHRWYERRELKEILKAAGFDPEELWADLAGTPVRPSPEWFAVVARREP